MGLWPLMALVPCRSASWGGEEEERDARQRHFYARTRHHLCVWVGARGVGGEGEVFGGAVCSFRPCFDGGAVPDVLSLPPAVAELAAGR